MAKLEPAGRRAGPGLEPGPVAEMAPGERVAGPQALDGALEDHLATGSAGAGAQVDHVVGGHDHLRLVLDHQNGVALVPQLTQQGVHPLDVMGVEAGRGLIEDVGDIRERRADVADHLHALRLAAREGSRRPLEREVAEADLDERVEQVPEGAEQWRHRRLVEVADPGREVADLHRARIGDADAPDPRRTCPFGEAGAPAGGTGREGDRPVHERADVRLQGFLVL